MSPRAQYDVSATGYKAMWPPLGQECRCGQGLQVETSQELGPRGTAAPGSAGASLPHSIRLALARTPTWCL